MGQTPSPPSSSSDRAPAWPFMVIGFLALVLGAAVHWFLAIGIGTSLMRARVGSLAAIALVGAAGGRAIRRRPPAA